MDSSVSQTASDASELFRRYFEPGGGSVLSELVRLSERDPEGFCCELDATLAVQKSAPYLWALRAMIKDAFGDRWSAMQSWTQTSALLEAHWDPVQNDALGWRDETQWRTASEKYRRMRAELLRDAYSDIRKQFGPSELIRIDRAVAGYLGEAVVIPKHRSQRPKVLFVPGLGESGFLEPLQHPVARALVAHSEAIRREYVDVFSEGVGVQPFLGELKGGDADRYIAGDGVSPGWDAFFFFRHGVRFESNHQRCPQTSALLDSQDLCKIDGQAPEVCFSIMRPGTRIQPHHGVTNARVVIHIPLVVPPGCYLELTNVGRHYWEEGRANVFDDTFEHSAENPTQQPRGILLTDAWHPSLLESERLAFRMLVEAITRIETPSLTHEH